MRIYTKLTLASVALASLALTACSDSKDDVKAPETVNPNGIVLISTPDEISAGDTDTITFRVNPSTTTTLTKENIALDCASSALYEVQITDEEKAYYGTSNAPASGASYVTASDVYTIVSLTPDTRNGQELDGQYKLVIKAQSDRNIIDKSKWALVYTYTTTDGKTVNLSSETFSMTQMPNPTNGLFIWAPLAYSVKAGGNRGGEGRITKIENDTINGAKVFVSAHTYKEAATGRTIAYDFDKYITSTSIDILNGNDTIPCETGTFEMPGIPGHFFVAVPIIAEEPFKSYYEGNTDKKYATFTLAMKATDKFGKSSVWKQNINYVIAKTINATVDMPNITNMGHYNIEVSEDALKECGIDLSINKRYPLQKASTSFASPFGLSQLGYTAFINSDGLLPAILSAIKSADATEITPEKFCSYLSLISRESNTVTNISNNYIDQKSCTDYLSLIFLFYPKQ